MRWRPGSALALAGLLAGLLTLFLAPPAAAGPWPEPPGGYYLKLSASLLDTDTLATPDGTQVKIPDYRRQEVGLYLQYGLSRRWTLIAQAPLYRRSEIEGFGSASGVGDLQVGAQFLLGRKGPWVFAARAVLQAPTGDETAGEGILPTGSGVWEGEGWLSVGRTFAGGRWYAFTEAGHQVRGGGLSDGFLHRTQVGVHAGRKVLLTANLWGVEPYRERGTSSPASTAGLGDGVGYLAYGPSLILDLPGRWALQLDAEDATRERNLATGLSFRLGLVLQSR